MSVVDGYHDLNIDRFISIVSEFGLSLVRDGYGLLVN